MTEIPSQSIDEICAELNRKVHEKLYLVEPTNYARMPLFGYHSGFPELMMLAGVALSPRPAHHFSNALQGKMSSRARLLSYDEAALHLASEIIAKLKGSNADRLLGWLKFTERFPVTMAPLLHAGPVKHVISRALAAAGNTKGPSNAAA